MIELSLLVVDQFPTHRLTEAPHDVRSRSGSEGGSWTGAGLGSSVGVSGASSGVLRRTRTLVVVRHRSHSPVMVYRRAIYQSAMPRTTAANQADIDAKPLNFAEIAMLTRHGCDPIVMK